jgi:hypothetical protein
LLRGLTINTNGIGAEGMQALAPALPQSLLTLRLEENSIGPEGAKALALVGPKLLHLSLLNLFLNNLELDGIEALLAAGKKHRLFGKLIASQMIRELSQFR